MLLHSMNTATDSISPPQNDTLYPPFQRPYSKRRGHRL